ncbi:hypothetical protein [Rhizobium sp. HT1-10]|uniref:hypothetical protein n=1 Tax=Rhizobium sp. HT1-10 TaxID=3111638 RepID=UPI003C26CFB6
MADFVAVIRRAVDGLSDNTPEMRVKVYARARGAVQRQLESMKPRPPETMLQRQLEKLEAAIRDVEAEHAEAGLEPVNEVVGEATEAYAPSAEPYHAPEPQQVSEPEPEPIAEPEHVAEPERAPEPEHAPEPAHAYEPEHAPEPAPAYEPVQNPTPEYVPEPAAQEQPAHVEVEPAYHAEAPSPSADDTWREEDDWAPKPDVQPEPVEVQEHLYDVPDHERYREPSASVVSSPVEDVWPRHEPEQEISHPADEEYGRTHEPAPEVAAALVPDHFISETHSDPVYADRAAHFDDVWAEVATPEVDARGEPDHSWSMPVAAEPLDPTHPGPAAIPVRYPPDVGFTANEHPAARMPEAAEPFAWDAATFDELPPVKSESVAPAKPVLPIPAGDFDDVDLFSDVHGTPAKPAAKPAPADGWNEIKELSGYEKFAAETDFGDPTPSDLGQVSVAGLQGKSYRMEPRRQRFGAKGILLSLIGVAVVGGAGYAAWSNRDALNQMVAGLVSSATKDTAAVDKSATAPAATTPASTTPAAGTPDTSKPSTAPQTASAPAATAVAPDNDGNTVNTKFTQRLMADGTEVDAGVPPVPGGPVAAEGKSIAQQNVAASTPPPAAGAPAADAAPATPSPTPAPASAAPDAATTPPAAVPSPTANVPSATPPVATQTATVGSPQKMFLYEERLGQTSPTAIEGTVTWSVQEDKGDDGKPSPAVQGSINVPERGMTALVTFKRNTDPSLPASHLIELVFSLPPNFEGGAIDSVQRVAMKATEQDRGDPLIGVPAKITDDFHMVALNDFPDARKTNLDLLRSRKWIDIPVTYRNGRRALLTMDKGDTGTDAFNKVIGEWAAIAGPSNGQ